MFKNMDVQIDASHTISVDYFDFTIPSAKEIETYQTVITAQLYYLASLFKYPFYQSLGLINRNNLPWKASIFNKPFGIMGAMVTFPAWAVGAIFEQSGLWLEGKAIKYYQSPRFKPKHEDRPLNHASHNIAFLPEVVSNDSRLDLAVNRLPGLIASLLEVSDKIDVICLQEVFCYSEEIIKVLERKYGFFLHHVARDACLLDSGLMIISKQPIVEGRFIKPPLPLLTPVEGEEDYSEIFIEALTNKGILMVVVKNGDHYDLVINAHLKSESNENPKVQRMISALRAAALLVIMQEMHNYIDELKQRGIKIRNVHFGGDTNASDIEETGLETKERSQHSTFFQHVFPGKAQPTWLGGYNAYHQRADVTFDHVGVLHYSNGYESESKYNKTISIHPNSSSGFGPISDHHKLCHLFTRKESSSPGGEEFSSPGLKGNLESINGLGKFKLE